MKEPFKVKLQDFMLDFAPRVVITSAALTEEQRKERIAKSKSAWGAIAGVPTN